jgi:hypothetical protein
VKNSPSRTTAAALMLLTGGQILSSANSRLLGWLLLTGLAKRVQTMVALVLHFRKTFIIRENRRLSAATSGLFVVLTTILTTFGFRNPELR